jgi:hypothetical protein
MWRDRAKDETCPASFSGREAGVGVWVSEEADPLRLQVFRPSRGAVWPIPIGGPEEARRAFAHTTRDMPDSRGTR